MSPPPERWTHNVSYQQLVASASVGLAQVWRLPGVVRAHGLLPCLLAYALLSALLGYPAHYLELAVGAVTRKGALRCWDLAPIGRGIGWAMLLVCAHTALALSALSAYSLHMLADTFRKQLPWLHCREYGYDAALQARPCAMRHALPAPGQRTPSEAYFLYEVLRINRKGIAEGLGKIQWQLVLCYVISWVFIYLVVIKGIYSYSKVVLFQAVLTFFVLLVSTVAMLFTDATYDNMMSGAHWDQFIEVELYRVMAEQVLMELAVAQGTLIMLGSCNVESRKLHRTTLFSVLISKLVSLSSLFVMLRAEESLDREFNLRANKQELLAGPGVPIVLWADLVTRIPGNHFWSALIYFTLFTVSVTTVALLMQTMLSNVKGKSVDKLKWAITFIMCFVFCMAGVMSLCTQGGVFIVGLLDCWPASMPRLPLAALTALVITFFYGQKEFCEHVYFTLEEYPNVFLRVCWSINPLILLVLFVCGCALPSPRAVYGVAFPPDVALLGWALVALALLPVPLLVFIYLIFRWRIRNIVDNEK